jgi:hypothetical protein
MIGPRGARWRGRAWEREGERSKGAQLWGCSLGSSRRARCGLPCSAATSSLLHAEREEGERRRKRIRRKRQEKKKKGKMENFPNLKISGKSKIIYEVGQKLFLYKKVT